ncbi:MAG: hypothetical protein LBQ52_02630 [Helicobacteraceae bacterium]|jgi:hypothetical protein|nr:hypothetical protein [Helicobacteraceae bacterium]
MDKEEIDAMNLNYREADIDLGFENPKIGEAQTIFIDKIIVDKERLKKLNGKKAREIYIFCGKVKTGEISSKWGEVCRAQFAIVEKELQTGKQKRYVLAQYSKQRSVMYKNESDQTENESADMIKKSDILYFDKPPRWKRSEASIPTYNKNLFYFSSQYYIPINKTNKTYFWSGESVYVFLYITKDDELLVQIFMQSMSEQTAQEHYKLEETIAEFERNHKDLSEAEKLIKNGSKLKLFYEYIIDSHKANKPILEILLKYAKTKSLKAQIEKLLR